MFAKKMSGKISAALKNEKQRKKIIFFGTIIVVLVWLFWGMPLPTRLASKNLPVSTKILDRNGKLIYEIYAEQRRTPVEIKDLPTYIKSATIAIEDKDFYKHYGFSPSGMTRAVSAAARRLPKNSRRTKTTMTRPSASMRETVQSVFVTSSVRS